MKQLTIWDFLDEVVEEAKLMTASQAKKDAEAIDKAYNAATDETPTKLDDIIPEDKPKLSAIETIICNYLANLQPNTLPSLEDAQVIAILDNIWGKYNAS